ncbi:MAG: hypothetical protein V1733_06675 [bacterium]
MSGLKSGALFRKSFLLVSALFFVPGSLHSQYYFNTRCQEAYIDILNFRFLAAERVLQKEKLENPANLIPYYLENYIDFFILFTKENRVEFEQIKQHKSARLDLLENGDEDSPYYRFCLAGVNLQWALTRLKFGEYTTAAFEIKRAYHLLTENQELFPQFLPNNVGLGILHILVGLIPDDYRWLANIAGLEGSIEQGVQELNSVLLYQGNDPVFTVFKPESCFYLAFVNANLGLNKQDALELVRKVDQDNNFLKYNQSPLLVYVRASTYMKNGKNDEVILLLEGYQPPVGVYPIVFLDYMEGLSRLNHLDLSAAKYLRKFLKEFHGINYIKSAYQKLAWCYLLQGDTVRYTQEITNAGKKGYAVVDEDKQAYSEYNVWIRPAIPLLKARLLFDGGYNQQALNILLNTSLESYVRGKKDLTEYTYRLGRIYHEMGNIPKAIFYYTEAITNGKSLPYYYAANAALKLGNIYERQGNYLTADTNYQICASLKYDEYENSLRQKAKAGLRRIKHSRR